MGTNGSRDGIADKFRMDDCFGQMPAFVLVAITSDGAKPVLSEKAQSLLAQAGGSTFQLALSDTAALGCEYHVAAEDTRWKKSFEELAPFCVLLRPDRFVLGAASLEYAEELVLELGAFLLHSQIQI